MDIEKNEVGQQKRSRIGGTWIQPIQRAATVMVPYTEIGLLRKNGKRLILLTVMKVSGKNLS